MDCIDRRTVRPQVTRGRKRWFRTSKHDGTSKRALQLLSIRFPIGVALKQSLSDHRMSLPISESAAASD
eukprot:scaffold76540_cov29-Prasinocladus_malaysianus.AAC.2